MVDMQIAYHNQQDFVAGMDYLTRLAPAVSFGAFERTLSRAMSLYCNDGDRANQSLGTAWILQDPRRFALAITDPYAFLMKHLDQPHSSDRLICSAGLLTLLSVAQCQSYVHEAYVRNGAYNNSWVDAALVAGLSRHQIAQAIIRRLEKGSADNQKVNVSSRYDDFLSFGAGNSYLLRIPANDPANWQLDIHSPWGVCSDEEFQSAINHCIEKAPHRVLENRARLSARLTEEQVKDVCERAAIGLDDLRYQKLEDLLLLPQNVREGLLYSVDIDIAHPELYIQLLVHTVFGAQDSQKLLSLLDVRLYSIDAKVAYIAALTATKQYEGPLVQWIMLTFAIRLRLAGYRTGTIEEGTYEDRRSGTTRHQLCVLDGGVRYVQHHCEHRYFPKKGDRVIFRPDQGRELAPRVKAVYFTPIAGNRHKEV